MPGSSRTSLDSSVVFQNAFDDLWRAKGEHDVRDALHDTLKALGAGRFNLEYPLDTGPVDMVSEERRVLVETKSRGAASPRKTGSREDETQKDQVERYLRDARQRWLGDLFMQDAKDGEPRAFLTDGVYWWGYEVGPTDRLKVVVSNKRTATAEALRSFLLQHVLPADRRYKLPVPDDLIGELLSGFATDLEVSYRRLEGSIEVRTKVALWSRCLSGAGMVPPNNEPAGQASLFVRHTVLVIAARLLKTLLRRRESSNTTIVLKDVLDGFPAWLNEVDDCDGLLRNIADKLDQYQWRGHAKDCLKSAYHKLIAKDERKEFGEYYTPDWLAQKVVDQTLDERWMEDAIRVAATMRSRDEMRGLTVLDPACGSGTFLFHAARRLLRYIKRKHPRRMRSARKIITRIVVGIDIHPIAVEMAEATLEMALPPSRGDRRATPQVFLGDAMQSQLRADLSKTSVFAESALGTKLTIPSALVEHPDWDALISRFVEAATEGEDAVFPELKDRADRAGVLDAMAALRAIIERESNHVWVWHLRNIAGPIHMGHSKAGRIVANPPWLMANDTPDGVRKKLVAALREEYGLRSKVLRRRRATTVGDLAAIFAARTTDLYLVAGGKMGLVLPGGVLINQNWAPWRSGCWHGGGALGCHANLTGAWGMDDLEDAPFPHAPSGSCVVFAERLRDGAKCNPNDTELTDANVDLWSGFRNSPNIRRKKSLFRERSQYLSDWDRGVMAEPQGLICVLKDNVESTRSEERVRVATKTSTKKPWAGTSLEEVIERAALVPLARPQGLRAFCVDIDAYLIAPLRRSRDGTVELPDDVDDQRFREMPRTRTFWLKAERIYQRKRTSNAGETLLDNLDWMGKLTKQLAFLNSKSSRRLRKVVYNKSGSLELRAARCPLSMIVNGSLYWMAARSEGEALYLCGVINAPVLQSVWRSSKTSKLHFDKSPWRSVPVPRYDSSNAVHRCVAEAARNAERNALKGADWRTDDCCAVLNSAVQRLLPAHAASSSSYSSSS